MSNKLLAPYISKAHNFDMEIFGFHLQDRL